ncbi:MAG TPA: site-2 protease family protein [Pseudonocardiaceae bacterium]|jgi:Zn-dependent protease
MMDAGDGELRVARVFGVPVLLSPSWWLGALVITVAYLPVVRAVLPDVDDLAALAVAVGMAVLLAASVLAHELGHCAVALRLGLPVRRVRLFLLGGVSELARPPLRPRDDALIAAAGPAVSVAVAALAAAVAVAADPGTVEWLLAVQLAITNAVVAAFNLLPGLPLDGGRILRAAVWSATGNRGLGSRGAAVGGVLVGVLLVGWGLAALGSGAPGSWLQFGVAALMAWYVLAGAFAELGRQRRPAAAVPLIGLVQPLLQLPAESPISDALYAAAGRGVLLVRPDGVAAGLLDPRAAAELAGHAPLAPAGGAAHPVAPDAVLLDSELRGDPAAALERLQASPAWQFLVVDADGRPAGVLRRADVYATLAEHRRW